MSIRVQRQEPVAQAQPLQEQGKIQQKAPFKKDTISKEAAPNQKSFSLKEKIQKCFTVIWSWVLSHLLCCFKKKNNAVEKPVETSQERQVTKPVLKSVASGKNAGAEGISSFPRQFETELETLEKELVELNQQEIRAVKYRVDNATCMQHHKTVGRELFKISWENLRKEADELSRIFSYEPVVYEYEGPEDYVRTMNELKNRTDLVLQEVFVGKVLCKLSMLCLQSKSLHASQNPGVLQGKIEENFHRLSLKERNYLLEVFQQANQESINEKDLLHFIIRNPNDEKIHKVLERLMLNVAEVNALYKEQKKNCLRTAPKLPARQREEMSPAQAVKIFHNAVSIKLEEGRNNIELVKKIESLAKTDAPLDEVRALIEASFSSIHYIRKFLEKALIKGRKHFLEAISKEIQMLTHIVNTTPAKKFLDVGLGNSSRQISEAVYRSLSQESRDHCLKVFERENHRIISENDLIELFFSNPMGEEVQKLVDGFQKDLFSDAEYSASIVDG